MSILLVAKNRDLSPFKESILQIDKNLDVQIWPNVKHPNRIQFAVAWNQPRHVFDTYKNLKVISSLGAGADHLLNDETIPDHIRFTKIYDPSMVTQMNDYVHSCVLSIMLKLSDYRESDHWNPRPKYSRNDLHIGVMGLGSIGKETAIYLAKQGFSVSGLSNTEKKIPGIQTYTSDAATDFWKEVNILINLLPLTEETKGILNLELFKTLKNPAFIINIARGGHLVDEDLIYALDTNIVETAYLDVFSDEPLPKSHPFWSRKNIFITPHIAAISDPKNAAKAVVENYKRLLSGIKLNNEVDKSKGY